MWIGDGPSMCSQHDDESHISLTFQVSTENRYRKEALTHKFKREHRKQEKELRNETGKKPFFLKKSQLRQMVLEEKYQNLKKTAQLDRFLEKKRRHRASQLHTLIPRTRRQRHSEMATTVSVMGTS
jgi:hypothetical protein